MPIRSAEENNLHNRLILGMVNHLLSNNFSVSADHIGYPNGKPEKIHGYTPDIYAKKSGKIIIVEAETCGSLNNDETRVQWTAFAQARNVNTEFHIIVPSNCLKDAKLLAQRWNTKIDNFWTMEV